MQSTIGNVPSVSRRLRHPVHPFWVQGNPFGILPFFIAPVLPGETMKNLSLQARVVTLPIKNSLIGWWNEFYLFYCKHRDLDESALYQQMVLDPGVSMTGSAHWVTAGVEGSSNIYDGFHTGTGMNWMGACKKTVIREYFRDEGDTTPHTAYGVDLATVSGNNWMDSITLESVRAPADVNVDINADTVIKASEVEQAMRTYEMMVAGGLVNMSYEDWLRSYGVRQSQAVRNVPELIRFVRTWTYPSSHIDPVSGAASSACSWSIAERADKDRFFAEPGFLVGFCVTRPKVYLSNMKQPAVSLMNDAFSWLPAVLRDDAGASLKKIVDSTNDIAGGALTGDWWIDLKDLLLYGDQFFNAPFNTAGVNLAALPTATGVPRYVSQTDIDGLFVTPATANAGVRMDGVVRLSILGTQEDTTPRGSSLGRIA